MDNPVTASISLVTKALSDPACYNNVPGFKALRDLAININKQVTNGKGCSSCKKRRLLGNLMTEFGRTVAGLDDTGRQKLREYFKRPLLITTRNPKTGKVTTIKI